MKELKASPTGCEEASIHSHHFYIPCDKPATKIIKTRDPKAYRMCDQCAWHNINNRGASQVGVFIPEHKDVTRREESAVSSAEAGSPKHP